MSVANNKEIITRRVFHYSREQVFAAWTDPQLLAQWWGPRGFTNTIHEFDLKPGGKWKFTMHGPGGTDYLNENRFTEIIAPETISFKHIEPVHVFMATVIFEWAGDSTHLAFSMKFESAEEFERVKDFIAVANEENFDRLESVLSDNNK